MKKERFYKKLLKSLKKKTKKEPWNQSGFQRRTKKIMH